MKRAPLALALLLLASCASGNVRAGTNATPASATQARTPTVPAATTVVPDPEVARPPKVARPPEVARATLVVLGDSLSRPVGNTELADRDWLRWADPEHRFEVVANAAVAGERSDQILARVERDVLVRDPDWVTVLAGTNDVGAGIGAMTIIANLIGIYDQLSAAGIRFVALTLPPILMLEPEEVATHLAVNAWIRDHVEADWPGAVLADWAPALSADGDGIRPLAEWFADGVHFSADGAAAAGQAVRPVFEAISFG